jgi:hypothetical protein
MTKQSLKSNLGVVGPLGLTVPLHSAGAPRPNVSILFCHTVPRVVTSKKSSDRRQASNGAQTRLSSIDHPPVPLIATVISISADGSCSGPNPLDGLFLVRANRCSGNVRNLGDSVTQ